MHLYYQYQGGAPQDSNQDLPTVATADSLEASGPYPLKELTNCFSQVSMALPSNMVMHRLNAMNSPQTETPRSLPSGSHPYMPSQPSSGQNGESWSRPASVASDCDSFSYQGSPAPANTWLTPGMSTESSAVPSPQSCWSTMKHDTVGTHQQWPAGQQPLPSSYDITMYMSQQDVDNLHPGLRTHDSRSGTPSFQSRAHHNGFNKEDFEDEDDIRDWSNGCDDRSGAKPEEGSGSYAKLLRRALLDSPRHAMLLKDIYQWFKDNTTKPGTDPESKENKGWTNSVRHNLSMNKAFIRCSRAPTPADGQGKKLIYEWCLQPWAVDNENFRSTTKYRNEDENGNPKKTTRPTRPKTKVANRSAAGRKGGLEAGRSRMAIKKAQQDLVGQYRPSLAQMEHSCYSDSYQDFDRSNHDHQRSSPYPPTGYGVPVGQGFQYDMPHQGYEQLSAQHSPSSSYSIPAIGPVYPMPGSDLSQQHPGPMYWQEQDNASPYHS